MDLQALQTALGFIPGSGLAALFAWFALKKDKQVTELLNQLKDIAKDVAVSNQKVASSMDDLRDAIRMGTRQ